MSNIYDKIIMTILPGDFHFSMHMMECILKVFYTNWLQCFQFAAEFKNIKKDPKERYQRSKDFLSLVGWELEQAQYFLLALVAAVKLDANW